jgi:hypothetical protein
MNLLVRCALRSRPVYKAVVLLATLPILLAGCGGNSHGSGTTLTGNTMVTVLATSTANDQLTRFNLTLSSLTLTSKTGDTITVFSTPQSAEFIHLNGGAEPLVSASLPQDVYVSAAATVEGFGNPNCLIQIPSKQELLFNAGIVASAGPTTVNVPAPITVTGSSMGLALNLDVSKSISPFDCASDTNGSATTTPTFNLTPVVIADQPTNSTNGKVSDLYGMIGTTGANGSSFSVTASDGPNWQVKVNSSTVFEGITGASQLATGLPVSMDAAIQADGSLLATRIELLDTNPANLTTLEGPLAAVTASEPVLLTQDVENQGPLLAGLGGGGLYFNFGESTLQASAEVSNLKSLPFAASFTAANMVDGQRVLISTHASSIASGPTYIPAATVTLLPQTIDGTVTAISSEGSFTTYTVTLASYDLFTNLAVQPGQASLLTNPSTVVVYADSSTQMVNASTPVEGSVFRFTGLVFNDNGTLRMDCAQINDGVTE